MIRTSLLLLELYSGIDAIVCLQSDLCFEAMGIDIDAIREKCVELDILHLRAPVYDFNRLDQERKKMRMSMLFSIHTNSDDDDDGDSV